MISHGVGDVCRRREAHTAATVVGCAFVTGDGSLDLVDDSRHDGLMELRKLGDLLCLWDKESFLRVGLI